MAPLRLFPRCRYRYRGGNDSVLLLPFALSSTVSLTHPPLHELNNDFFGLPSHPNRFARRLMALGLCASSAVCTRSQACGMSLGRKPSSIFIIYRNITSIWSVAIRRICSLRPSSTGDSKLSHSPLFDYLTVIGKLGTFHSHHVHR